MSVPVIIRRARWVVGAAVAVGLFFAYLLMSRAVGVNSDGASNALQAWDMLDGNVLLRGWTVTDVSFYTNELLLFALVEATYGFHGDTTHAVAALVFTLLVLVVAAAAKGRATGREAVVRVALAVAIVAVPALGFAAVTQLTSPDHTGTAIPLLLTWLLVERAAGRKWLPYAVAGLLAWAQIADPLVMYIGVLPLLVVSAWRLLRDRTDLALLIAGPASIVLAQLALLAIRLGGGFGAHAAEAKLSPLSDLGHHLWLAARVMSVNFGAYFPDREGPAGMAMAAIHLIGLLATLAAVVVAAARTVRGPHDRMIELLTVGILVNLGAFVVSALPTDLLSARQVVAILPLGAVLVARIFGPPLAAAGHKVTAALAVLLMLLAGELVAHATVKGVPGHAVDVARWLDDRGLAYGIGEYWNANNVTVLTSGRVQVAPVVAGTSIASYRWESKEDWYDPAKHDARFLVIDTRNPSSRTEETARSQFGEPAERHEFNGAVVLIYTRNLLQGLPAYCVPETAPTPSACPDHGLVLF